MAHSKYRQPRREQINTFNSFRTWMEVALSDMSSSHLAGALEPAHSKERIAFTDELWRRNEMDAYMGRDAYVSPSQAAKLWVAEFKKRHPATRRAAHGRYSR